VSSNGSRANGPSGFSKARSAGRQGSVSTRRGENQPAAGAGTSAGDLVRHRVHLSGGRDAVPGARAAIDLLTVALFDEISCEDIRLMVSELVGNSVRHGGAVTGTDDIELTVFVGDRLLRVECSDPGAGFDVPDSAAGYGLEIIAALSSDWGAGFGPLGSTWFEYSRVAGLEAPVDLVASGRVV
jgi:anti-sigma regulatory factor (Ser/Thr protein kinase)